MAENVPLIKASGDELFGRPTRIVNGVRVYADPEVVTRDAEGKPVVRRIGSEVGGEFDLLTRDIPDPSRDEGFLYRGYSVPTPSMARAQAHLKSLGERQRRALTRR